MAFTRHLDVDGAAARAPGRRSRLPAGDRTGTIHG
jgi:hypothetical protein